ncbi:hypothetical protein WDU94_003903 [Cyamophila willieti]
MTKKKEKADEIVGFEDPTVIISTTDDVKGGDKKKKLGGGFQSLGLSFEVLKGILKRGYKIPTPIQRKTMPLILEGRDVVAMARTGSGKTACFLIPMLEKLKTHSPSAGMRALILSPTRELALQTFKFVKELGKFTKLQSTCLLGGDSMDNQFARLLSSPDIVVATPGRFLHIVVEMELKLSSVQYVVFDEADRLFEMGFGEQLTEIIHRLPDARQTLLFSATLPKVLVQFARAGLSDPVLIRLDVENKVPDTLQLGYFSCRPDEKEAALLCLLKHVIPENAMTIVFAATKYHVEYVHKILGLAGISSTYIYSDLDPTARKINAAKFQTGRIRVLVVTDVAARGIDIPSLDAVINYNFPSKAKLFVHRVGRCARAGRSGVAYSLVSTDELCYYLDLLLFLGRKPLIVDNSPACKKNRDGLFGKIPQALMEDQISEIMNWVELDADMEGVQRTCANAYKKYIKSRPGASVESVKKVKDLDVAIMQVHPLFRMIGNAEEEKYSLLSKMSEYRPSSTVLEFGKDPVSKTAALMRHKRKLHEPIIAGFKRKREEVVLAKKADAFDHSKESGSGLESSNVDDVESTFGQNIIHMSKKKRKQQDRVNNNKVDSEFYIPYKPSDQYTEQGLSLTDFKQDSSRIAMDLVGDSAELIHKQKQNAKKWDPVKKKYVGVTEDVRMVRSESGGLIRASYKTDRFKKWKERNKISDDADDEEKMSMISNIPQRFRQKRKTPDERQGIVKDKDSILKQRKIKEKRRERDGQSKEKRRAKQAAKKMKAKAGKKNRFTK